MLTGGDSPECLRVSGVEILQHTLRTMPIQNNEYPGWNQPRADKQGYTFRRQRPVSKMIRDHGGVVLTYRQLPPEAQLSLAQYMSIDGEAWDVAPVAQKYLDANPGFMRHYYDNPDAEKQWEKVMRASLPFYVRTYGNERFGYIAELPIKVLIRAVLKDRDIQDSDSQRQTWEKYHRWYMDKGVAHTASSKNPWPVMLSS
jgi:hypothetical protein